MTDLDHPATITLPFADAQALFDMTTSSLNFGSGFLETYDVDLLRRLAVAIGVDPMLGTPDPGNLFGLHWSNWFWPHQLQSKAASKRRAGSSGVGPNPVARRPGGAKRSWCTGTRTSCQEQTPKEFAKRIPHTVELEYPGSLWCERCDEETTNPIHVTEETPDA